MRFSEEIRQQADKIFEGILRHPIVLGIAKGEVPNKVLIHYVKANAEFLRAYSQVCNHAISACDKQEDKDFFRSQVEAVLPNDNHPHQNLCRVIGVNYKKLQGSTMPPTAHHYIAHLTKTAQTGSYGEVISALLPCPWTYLEIGLRINGRLKPVPAHPFYDWINFYADLRMAETISKLRDLLDDWAETASDLEKQRAKDTFLYSCQLEYMFWEMSYSLEDWPFNTKEEELKL